MGDPQHKAERKSALYDALARTGKALSNGKRLELLDVLAQGERSVDALAQAAGLGLTTASAHLQTLKQAGLVTTRRDGVRIHYRLAGDDVAALYGLLLNVAHTHQPDADHARTAYLGPDDTDEVTRDELLDRVKAGTATVIDVRPAEEYTAGHIPGALSLPLDQLAARLAELPENANVVAYCRGTNCVLAHDAVRLLTAHGRRAARLIDGMLEWRLDHRPVATGTA
ncbi:ArsR family transcriptional regulator [Parafrankia soli]|uniref:ArsR family transcriptional regulator n=1 Tax=Parafrankia soli TaxID=2599596 RepID=A0A1S1Q3F4_9ACTN|nr:metalloregulator ArsR/SmtB family transcription factor [Parafrankia soli]OHV28490.1 ArsR family transcriptional regulator [Parafrankia soli]